MIWEHFLPSDLNRLSSLWSGFQWVRMPPDFQGLFVHQFWNQDLNRSILIVGDFWNRFRAIKGVHPSRNHRGKPSIWGCVHGRPRTFPDVRGNGVTASRTNPDKRARFSDDARSTRRTPSNDHMIISTLLMYLDSPGPRYVHTLGTQVHTYLRTYEATNVGT